MIKKRSIISPLLSLALLLLVSGTISMLIAHTHTRTHQGLSNENQQELWQYFISAKAKERLKSLESEATSLKQFLVKQQDFNKSLADKNPELLSRILDEQYRQRFITADIIHVIRFTVFDTDFNIIASSARNLGEAIVQQPVCLNLPAQAVLRKGPHKLQRQSDTCIVDSKPIFSVLFPAGGLNPDGYLQIDIDLGIELLKLQPYLGSEIRIMSAKDKILHTSDGWNDLQAFNPLLSTYLLKSSSGDVIAKISVASNNSKLETMMRDVNRNIYIARVLLIVATLLIAIWIIKQQVMKPLRLLTSFLSDNNNHTVTTSGQVNLSCDNPPYFLNNHIFGNLYRQLCKYTAVDRLTGLYNRHHFLNKLELLLRESKNNSCEVVLFLIDINNFSLINDTFGQYIADRVIINVANRLLGNQNPDDILSRIGNDQFTLLIENMDQPEAEKTARTIINICSMEMLIADYKVHIEVSVGITAMYKGTDSIDTVLKQATQALLEAQQDPQHFFWQPPYATKDSQISG